MTTNRLNPNMTACLRTSFVLAFLAATACGSTETGESTSSSEQDSTSDDDTPLMETQTADEIPDFDVSAVDFPFCEEKAELVDSIYESMSVRQRIGQHLMLGIGRQGENLLEDSRELIADLHMGGAFTGPPYISLDTPIQTARFLREAQQEAIANAGVPLFISLDQEGGANAVVNSLTGGTDTLGSLPLGATMDPQIAYEQFDLMGREVSAMGFNMALAPVLDTLTSTRNGNLNTRSFGPNVDLNVALGKAAFAGFQQNLVLAVGKHFPGDGLSDGNPHTTFVTVDADRETLDATLLKPFRKSIEAGIDGIMTMPARFTAIDPDRSIIISHTAHTVVLREELGFDGLIVSDSLGMEGAKQGLPEGQSEAFAALQAGADYLLNVVLAFDEAEALVNEIEAALEDGSLDSDPFEASTKRILRYKQRYCLFELVDNAEPILEETLLSKLAQKEDRELSLAHAQKAITLIHDDGVLPLTDKKILYAGPDTLFQDPGSTWLNVVDQTFADALRLIDPDVDDVIWTLVPDPNFVFQEVMDKILSDPPDVLVIGTIQGRFSLEQQQMLSWLLDSVEIPVVHVILGVPFDYFQSRDRVAAALAIMGSRSVMVETGARILYGQLEAEGTMLYDLADEAELIDTEGPGEGESVDRCISEDVQCAGEGQCVDTGASFGCVCHPNWHPSDDGLDCVPDGQ